MQPGPEGLLRVQKLPLQYLPVDPLPAHRHLPLAISPAALARIPYPAQGQLIAEFRE